MTNAILSIKPVYVNRIRSGEKTYEFRKAIFKKKIDKVYIYESYPVQRIVGYFNYGDVISGSPESVWDQCKETSGISSEGYFDYYKNHDIANALAINGLVFFEEPMNPNELIPNFVPPQSYMYTEQNFEDVLRFKTFDQREAQTLYGRLKQIGEQYPNFYMWYHDSVLLGIPKDKYKVIVCTNGAEPLGVAVLKVKPAENKICTFFIFEDHRNKGLSSKLMEYCLRTLKDNTPLITINESKSLMFDKLFKKFNFKMIEKKLGMYKENEYELIFNKKIQL